MNTNMNAVPVTSEKVRTSSGEQPPPMHEKNAGGGSAMRACFEKGVDALGFTFQVHTTIDSKLCRPFRRFDRFYSGERKPGDDASD